MNCTDNVDKYIVPKRNATQNETLFPVGRTRVIYLCHDDSDNVGGCSFNVIVYDKSVIKWKLSEVVVILCTFLSINSYSKLKNL